MMKINIKPEYIYILKALGMLLVITFISNIFNEHLQIINIALIHIIPVIVVAVHGNLKGTVFITVLSVILLNFLYIPPLYSFNVNNELYIWSLIIFAMVGWIITLQAKNLHTQTKQNELKENLLNIISHDLRTPLSTIHGTINLLLENETFDEKSTRNLLEDVNYASLRMKRLITNLLDSTRLTDKNFDLKLEWCDFEDIVGVALEEFSKKQSEDLIDIKIDDMTLYWGDNTLLTQLMINLLDNETEYIDKKKLKNIFDKFYRFEDTNDISGSGIGLAICKSIVKLHNGDIKAITKENGISIEINLPIIKRVQI